MHTEAGVSAGTGAAADAASDASRRLERSRRAALSRTLAEERHLRATQAAAALAELLSDGTGEAHDARTRT